MWHLARHTRPGDSVLFLTPCHATPFYSHVHRAVRMRFLDCSPPGWAPVVACLNPSSAPPVPTNMCAAAVGMDAVAAGLGALGSGGSAHGDAGIAGGRGGGGSGGGGNWRLTQPAQLAYCRRRFNVSAGTDPRFRIERQRFEAAPAAFLEQQYPWLPPAHGGGCGGGGGGGGGAGSGDSGGASGGLPTHVVLFDHMQKAVASWSQPRGYVRTHRFGHALFAVDGDHEAALVVLHLGRSWR